MGDPSRNVVGRVPVVRERVEGLGFGRHTTASLSGFRDYIPITKIREESLVRALGNECQRTDRYLLQLCRADAARWRARPAPRRLGHCLLRRQGLPRLSRPTAERAFRNRTLCSRLLDQEPDRDLPYPSRRAQPGGAREYPPLRPRV